jgi:glucose/arabinose dehydrogenase
LVELSCAKFRPGADTTGDYVGTIVAKDGILLISEDGKGTIWRVS